MPWATYRAPTTPWSSPILVTALCASAIVRPPGNGELGMEVRDR